MKKLFFSFIILMISLNSLLANDVQGLTNLLPEEDQMQIIGKAKPYIPEQVDGKHIDSITQRENWTLIDSINIDSYIQPGDHISVTFDNSTNQIMLCSNFDELLIPEAVAAVEKAPNWLEAALINTFIELDEDTQLIWAEVINNANDPYIDEIAFSIANLSAEYLSSPYCYPEIFTDNALYLYIADITLNYVEIVDYGTSTTDEDYYSTTLYWKIDENGEQVQVEVPKEIYYMYIVHPKITDEIPAFIDPDIIEDNTTHNNNIVSPDEGVFWRYYIFNYNDNGYPLLRSEMMSSDVVWDISSNNPDDAIHKLGSWINSSMSFTSNAERPHQPVRIYKKHFGRCGEYADITAAACRSALIPCTSILAISGDHTWNEFWDEEWIQWEPVNGYINNPLVYENGWGKVFGSVFEIKSNGNLNPVTETYSEETAEITIYALDANDEPIDGARIKLRVDAASDNWGYTDNEGKYTFIVGDSRNFYARMDSDIGSDPIDTNQYYEVASNTVGGQSYVYYTSADGVVPEVTYNSVPVPEDDVDDFKLVIDVIAENQVITGEIIMDDLDSAYFYDPMDGGEINFFMADWIGYNYYTDGQQFDTFNEAISISGGNLEFNIPTDQMWYAFLDNGDNLNNPQHIVGSARLYEYEENSIDNDVVSGLVNNLSNYPNPFNPSTTISFSNTEITEDTEISIYNLKGQKVKTLPVILSGVEGYSNNNSFVPRPSTSLRMTQAGNTRYSVVWNGTDVNNQPVASGIYFYKLKAGKDTQTKKMILMK